MSLEKDITEIQKDIFTPASKKEVKLRSKLAFKMMLPADRLDTITDALLGSLEDAVYSLAKLFPEASNEELRSAYEMAMEEIESRGFFLE